MRPETEELSPKVWSAYFALIGIGGTLGFLYGADQVSLVALLVFVFGGFVWFIPWAVWKHDPSHLMSSDDYGGKESSD